MDQLAEKYPGLRWSYAYSSQQEYVKDEPFSKALRLLRAGKYEQAYQQKGLSKDTQRRFRLFGAASPDAPKWMAELALDDPISWRAVTQVIYLGLGLRSGTKVEKALAAFHGSVPALRELTPADLRPETFPKTLRIWSPRLSLVDRALLMLLAVVTLENQVPKEPLEFVQAYFYPHEVPLLPKRK